MKAFTTSNQEKIPTCSTSGTQPISSSDTTQTPLQPKNLISIALNNFFKSTHSVIQSKKKSGACTQKDKESDK